MAKIKCPDCDKIAKVTLRKRRSKAMCPRCKRVLRIPALDPNVVDDENLILDPLPPKAPKSGAAAPTPAPARPAQSPTPQQLPTQQQYPPLLGRPELFPPPVEVPNYYQQSAPPPMPHSNPVPPMPPVPGRPVTGQPIAKSRSTRTQSQSPIALQVILISMAIALLLAAIVGGGIYMVMLNSKTVVAFEQGLDAIPVPTPFPVIEGYDPREPPESVIRYDLTLDDHGYPGGGMQLRVFIPPGKHSPGTVPCILVAPAGTNLLSGSELYEVFSEAEFLPYVHAGMVVVHYSIDGPMVEPTNSTASNEDEKFTQMLGQAYPKFRLSGAGIVNGRNAIDFAIQKLPLVNEKRIYSAGHSSAGTLAMFLAANDPRISGCIAYAPAYDLEKRMGALISDPAANSILTGLSEFISASSPKNFSNKLRCPTFIFHSKEDGNVPFSDAEAFVAQLKAQNTPVTFKVAQHGDHYTPMINQGIPAAIEWINNGSN